MKSTRYVLNLSDAVLVAIGTVSAQWATIEFNLVRTTASCLHKYGNPRSKLSERPVFLEQRNAFVEALMWSNVDNDVQQAGIGLAERIESVENKRHVIIHGMANEYTASEGDLPPDMPNILISREHPKHYFSERFTVTQISSIADEIADINGDLLQLYFYLWGAAPHP